MNGKDKYRHRLAMEAALGRPLTRDEIVHHLDGNRHNYALSNLQLLTPLTHQNGHNRKHPMVVTCSACGKPFTPQRTRVNCYRFCTRGCFNDFARRVGSPRRWAKSPLAGSSGAHPMQRPT